MFFLFSCFQLWHLYSRSEFLEFGVSKCLVLWIWSVLLLHVEGSNVFHAILGSNTTLLEVIGIRKKPRITHWKRGRFSEMLRSAFFRGVFLVSRRVFGKPLHITTTI